MGSSPSRDIFAIIMSMNSFGDILILIKKHIGWFALLVYGSGFFIWNFYLLPFGIFEYNLIQTRFVSAGALFWIPIIALLLLSRLIERRSNFSELDKLSSRSLLAALLAFWVIMLPTSLFQQIPSYAGGARSIPVSVIGSPGQIEYLENFGVHTYSNGEGNDPIQTTPLCLVYQDDDRAILFFATYSGAKNELPVDSRVIDISKDNIFGLHPMRASGAGLMCDAGRIFFSKTWFKLN